MKNKNLLKCTSAVDTDSWRENLQHNLQVLFGIFNSMNFAIVAENEERRLVMVNKFFCELFHIPVDPQYLIGIDCSSSLESCKHLFVNPEETVTRVAEILTKQETVVAEECAFADGKFYERDYLPIFEDTNYRGHLWVYRDVTHLKEQYISKTIGIICQLVLVSGSSKNILEGISLNQ
jgi:hypothetical protein